MIRERLRHGLPGIPILIVALLALAALAWLFFSGVGPEPSPGRLLSAVGLFMLWMFLLSGFFMVAPNEAKVLQLFGDYVGTAKTTGLRYANPFYKKRKLSLRVRNFESARFRSQSVSSIWIGISPRQAIIPQAGRAIPGTVNSSLIRRDSSPGSTHRD